MVPQAVGGELLQRHPTSQARKQAWFYRNRSAHGPERQSSLQDVPDVWQGVQVHSIYDAIPIHKAEFASADLTCKGSWCSQSSKELRCKRAMAGVCWPD